MLEFEQFLLAQGFLLGTHLEVHLLIRRLSLVEGVVELALGLLESLLRLVGHVRLVVVFEVYKGKLVKLMG